MFKNLVALVQIIQFVKSSTFQQEDRPLVPVFQSLIGLILFLITLLIYVIEHRRAKELVEFEHFQIPHQSTPIPVIAEHKTENSTSFGSDSMKQVGFQSGQISPGEKKKRKRKAHRLSDRRRNETNQQAQQIEQQSQL